MANRALPPAEFLRQCFHYCQQTGRLWWKSRPRAHFKAEREWKIFNTQFAGALITARKDGYIVVSFSAIGQFRSHRIIWCWVTGYDPSMDLDHDNHNKADNRWINLRLATRRHNNANRVVQSNNRLGIKGVRVSGKKFVSVITYSKKTCYLGTFDTLEEAHDAYCQAAEKLYGEFACDGRKEND